MGWNLIKTIKKSTAETNIVLDDMSSLGKFAFNKTPEACGTYIVNDYLAFTNKLKTDKYIGDNNINITGEYHWWSQNTHKWVINPMIGLCVLTTYDNYISIRISGGHYTPLTRNDIDKLIITGGADIENETLKYCLDNYCTKEL